MNTPDPKSKLHMAPTDTPEPAELIEKRLEREKIAADRQREVALEQSLAPFRVGSPKALNTVPLVRGVEDEIIFAPPSRLAQMLQAQELDAALVSVVEPLRNDAYDVLDGIAVASLGEVKSVLLAHRQPLDAMREVFCDTASLTSIALLKVLLGERGLKPEFKPLSGYDFTSPPENLLLIGDAALDFSFGGHPHEVFDLGAAWYEMTQLPFVFAVWAMRRGVHNAALRSQLREARDFGMDTLDHLINSRTEYTLDFRKDYLGWHLHYHLGTDEKRGISRFSELLNKHGLGPIHKLRFVV